MNVKTNKVKFDQAKTNLLISAGIVLVGLKGKIVLTPQPQDKLASHVHLNVVPENYPQVQHGFDFSFDAMASTEGVCVVTTTPLNQDGSGIGESVSYLDGIRKISAHLSWFELFTNEQGYTIDAQVFKVDAGKTAYTVYVEDQDCTIHEIDCGKSSAKFIEALLLIEPDLFQSIELNRYSRSTALIRGMDVTAVGAPATTEVNSTSEVEELAEEFLREAGFPLDAANDSADVEEFENFTYSITDANVSFLLSTGDGDEDYTALYSVPTESGNRFFLVDGKDDADVEDESYLNGEVGREVSLHQLLDMMVEALHQCEFSPETFIVNTKTFDFELVGGLTESIEFRGSKASAKTLAKLYDFIISNQVPAVRTIVVHPKVSELGSIKKAIESFITDKKLSLKTVYADLISGVQLYGTVSVVDHAIYSFLGNTCRVIPIKKNAVLSENVPLAEAIEEIERFYSKGDVEIETLYDTMVCNLVNRISGEVGEKLRSQEYTDKLVAVVAGQISLESDIVSFINKNVRDAINEAYTEKEEELENLITSLRGYVKEIKSIIAVDESEK